MTCGIYKLTTPSGKVYIGQSRNIKNRFKEHKSDWKKCFNKTTPLINITKLRGSFKKYHWDDIKKEILEICEIKQLNEKEIAYINLYDSFHNGLNNRTGGNQNFIVSVETKEKLRLANLGKYGGVQAMDFYIDNIKYQSILEASVALNIPHKTIHNRLNSKNEKFSNYIYADESRIPKRKKRKYNEKAKISISINDINYESASDASLALKIPITTLLRRARSEKFPEYKIIK